MEYLISALAALVLVISFAVLANLTRRSRELYFDLKPNILMTRWPIIFVTGPRSLFYFRHYWNLYPVYLAEHGYEVYTVHLPWHKVSERRRRFSLFLQQQENTNKKFHLFLDESTRREMTDLIQASGELVTLTEIHDKHGPTPKAGDLMPAFKVLHTHIEFEPGPPAGFVLNLSEYLHRLFLKDPYAPSLNAMSANPKTALMNSSKILAHAQNLAEMDLRAE